MRNVYEEICKEIDKNNTHINQKGDIVSLEKLKLQYKKEYLELVKTSEDATSVKSFKEFLDEKLDKDYIRLEHLNDSIKLLFIKGDTNAMKVEDKKEEETVKTEEPKTESKEDKPEPKEVEAESKINVSNLMNKFSNDKGVGFLKKN